MDAATIGQLIGSVGFPIAACIFLFKQNSDMIKILADFKDTLKDISNQMNMLNERMNDIEDKL